MALEDEKAKPFEFIVSIMNKEVVVPLCSLPLNQERCVPMSNFDLLMLLETNYVSILCYKNPAAMQGSPPSSSIADFIGSLKKSMAQVLVSFYPLAGEVVYNTVGEPEILCNNRGVDFIEAYADVELENLNLHNFDLSFVVGKLVPEKKSCSIFTVQLTVLSCGSVVVVCLFDHRFIDGYSANMFIVSWAEFTLSKPLTYSSPLFQRSLVKPRNLGCIDTTFISETSYVNLLENGDDDDDDPIIISSRMYYIKGEHINNLQTLATSSDYKATKVEAFSAFLWKMISTTLFTTFEGEELCRLGILVDGRRELMDGGDDRDKMMRLYFGNVLSIPILEKKASDLKVKPLNEVAREVHKCMEKVLRMEHFLGILDWVEKVRTKSRLSRISNFTHKNDAPGIVVSSGTKFPIGEVDFGWGKPILGSFHFPMGMRKLTKCGYVLPMLSPVGNGDWLLYMQLNEPQLELLETQVSHILKPLTFDYLYSRVRDTRSKMFKQQQVGRGNFQFRNPTSQFGNRNFNRSIDYGSAGSGQNFGNRGNAFVNRGEHYTMADLIQTSISSHHSSASHNVHDQNVLSDNNMHVHTPYDPHTNNWCPSQPTVSVAGETPDMDHEMDFKEALNIFTLPVKKGRKQVAANAEVSLKQPKAPRKMKNKDKEKSPTLPTSFTVKKFRRSEVHIVYMGEKQHHDPEHATPAAAADQEARDTKCELVRETGGLQFLKWMRWGVVESTRALWFSSTGRSIKEDRGAACFARANLNRPDPLATIIRIGPKAHGMPNRHVGQAVPAFADQKYTLMKIRKEEVVAPIASTPEQWLPLSNLDLLFLSKTDVATFFVFKKPVVTNTPNLDAPSLITNMKKGLAQVLVPFFPVAGELVHNSVGEIEIWCNNRGVDFVEAYADVELEKLNFYNLDESFALGKLVPEKIRGILAVQATELKCGSVVVVTLYDHRYADGYSGSMFIVSWAEFTRSKPLMIYNRPSFRRSLLIPRRLGCIDTSVQDMYVDTTITSSTPNNKNPTSPTTLLNNDHNPNISTISSRLYHIKAEHIKQLQIQASLNNTNITKIESFGAFLWKMIAKYSLANNNKYVNNNKLCRMGFFIEGRKLLAQDDALQFYFGNVLSIPCWAKKTYDLNDEPLNQVAREIHECLRGISRKEHFLGILDWVEALRRLKSRGTFRISTFDMEDGPNFILSSGLRLEFEKVDFGWGKPILSSNHMPSGFQEISKGGYVMPLLIPNGSGDWVVYMHLHTSLLDFIETEASNFLTPLTFEHLGKINNTNLKSKI
ncbi:hypothetical protein G4B88_000032 [Cannabis sativa]|uniref:Uncharacterized protein n=1 Tax=Cannabis sativa TaxID=3483 RepID=A0A7J6G018_CANSA|nr:hypothetical protein G4B88_000032 [Cannabis sativa]